MNYPTKHRTKAIVQTQCCVAMRSAFCAVAGTLWRAVGTGAHVRLQKLALHKLWSLCHLSVPARVGSMRGATVIGKPQCNTTSYL